MAGAITTYCEICGDRTSRAREAGGEGMVCKRCAGRRWIRCPFCETNNSAESAGCGFCGETIPRPAS